MDMSSLFRDHVLLTACGDVLERDLESQVAPQPPGQKAGVCTSLKSEFRLKETDVGIRRDRQSLTGSSSHEDAARHRRHTGQ